MRYLAVALGISVSVLGCFSSSKSTTTGTVGTGGTAGGTTGTAGSAPSTSGTGGSAVACMAGETVCGNACITGTDCFHSVTVAPPSDGNFYVNGATFVELVPSNTNDILGVHVGDARVAFQAAEPGHFWIEIPPGEVGTVDVTVDVAGGSIVTKRVIHYRSVAEGTAWTTKTMAAARGGYPALSSTFDGRALLAGGYTVDEAAACTNTGDVFDHDTAVSTPVVGTMSTKRWTTTGTTMLTGTTLLAGACYTLAGCPYDSTLLDLFDVDNSQFSPAMGHLSVPRGFLRNLLLADGRVLIASDETPPFDIYDPLVDAVTPVVGGVFSTVSPVTGSVARLRDGTVLVVPGGGGANSIFDPVAGTFTPTGDSLAQYPDALIVLGNGHVLAVGGLTLQDQGGTTYQTSSSAVAELDPQTMKFSPWTATLATSREASTAVLGRDGMVYVIGGFSGTGKLAASCDSETDIAPFTFLGSVEVLDPAKATVTAGPALPQANASMRSVTLFDGSIIAGGGTPCGSKVMSYASVYFLAAPVDPSK